MSKKKKNKDKQKVTHHEKEHHNHGTFNPLELVKKSKTKRDDGLVEYLADPDEVYPVVLDAIENKKVMASAVRTPDDDEEIDPEEQQDHEHYCRRLTAMRSREEFDEMLELARTPVDVVGKADLKLREEMLEFARQWFTNELHRACNEDRIVLRWVVKYETETCPNCNGDGEVGSTTPVTCPNCGGAGELTRRIPSPWRLA